MTPDDLHAIASAVASAVHARKIGATKLRVAVDLGAELQQLRPAGEAPATFCGVPVETFVDLPAGAVEITYADATTQQLQVRP